MKKFLPLIIALLVILLGVGSYMLFANAQKSKSPTSMTPKTEENKTVFSSIQDALTKSLSLQCSFSDDMSRQTTAYIKAGAVRADITGKSSEDSGSMIMKDKKVYFWNPTTKQGFMVTITDEQLKDAQNYMANPSGAPTQTNQSASMLSALEKFKDHCKTAVIADSLFTLPTDVTFQDMSKFMPSVTKTTTPAVSGMPTNYQQQYQQIMQQYQQPTNQ